VLPARFTLIATKRLFCSAIGTGPSEGCARDCVEKLPLKNFQRVFWGPSPLALSETSDTVPFYEFDFSASTTSTVALESFNAIRGTALMGHLRPGRRRTTDRFPVIRTCSFDLEKISAFLISPYQTC
jgi:hypothetical protein